MLFTKLGDVSDDEFLCNLNSGRVGSRIGSSSNTMIDYGFLSQSGIIFAVKFIIFL
jgi:hypothetical protein